MNRCVKDCAPPSRIALWRNRALAFAGAALVGLLAPTGCVMGPSGSYPSRESIEYTLFGPDRCCGGCSDNRCEATCGAPAADTCDWPPSEGRSCHNEFDVATRPLHCERKKPWHHLPKCHLYEPEAGIFNFCIPPACINPPPPLPPGRFFPVPVRPAFAPQPSSTMSGYGLLNPYASCK